MGSKAGLRGVIDPGLPGVRMIVNLATGRASSGSKVIHCTPGIEPGSWHINICTANIDRCTADVVLCSAGITGAQQTSASAQETSKNSGKNCLKTVNKLCIRCGWIGISGLTICFISINQIVTFYWLKNNQISRFPPPYRPSKQPSSLIHKTFLLDTIPVRHKLDVS
jgi:hypothetical protein